MAVHHPKSKTVLCTWEIGGELGHISRLSAIAYALESHGYRVVVALKDLSRALPFFQDTRVTLLQAPVWLPRVTMQRPIACLADALLLLGYLEPDPLDCLVRAWRALFDLVKPDLVIFDYSPTAMLAFADRDVAKIQVGSGFCDPVPGHPIADWRPYASADQLVQRQENRVLQVVNEVRRRHQWPALLHLADMFAVDRVLITGFREFDSYGAIRQATYCLASTSSGKPPVRFPGGRPRLLAYLKPAHPQLAALLKGLALCGANVVVVCPGASVELLRAVANERLSFSTDLLDLPEAMAQADLFIGHGNAGTTREALVAGTPLMIFPIQLEQLLIGQKIQALGVGGLVEKIESERELAEQIQDLLRRADACKKAIAALLDLYPKPYLSVQDAVADACGQLLGAGQ
jgi:hypothetical protein